MKNKYVIRSHISEKKFREIIYLFSEDLSATQISHLAKISRPSVNKYLTAIRFRIFEYCQDQSPLKGEIEIVPDCSAVLLQKAIKGKVDVGNIIHSDGWGIMDL